MKVQSLKVSGSRESLDKLRQALLAEPQAASINVTELSEEPGGGGAVRVRDSLVTEAIMAFAVHIPAGIAAHMTYDWIRQWLRNNATAAQARVAEIPAPPSGEAEQS